MRIYKKYLKRLFDLFVSSIALIILSPMLVIFALIIKIKLGSPIIYKQFRPGRNEKIFCIYKFRTMTDECDSFGNLLSDKERLTKFGSFLRKTSIDELPSLFNIIKGDMSIVGPRPLLVLDMIFMSNNHRRRHIVRPGLTGLAQVNGRNELDWDLKLDYDIVYVDNISFLKDIRIILQTVYVALIKQKGISQGDMATSEDYCDYLLRENKISKQFYNQKIEEFKKIKFKNR